MPKIPPKHCSKLTKCKQRLHVDHHTQLNQSTTMAAAVGEASSAAESWRWQQGGGIQQWQHHVTINKLRQRGMVAVAAAAAAKAVGLVVVVSCFHCARCLFLVPNLSCVHSRPFFGMTWQLIQEIAPFPELAATDPVLICPSSLSRA
jgi:hypothetical protein